MEIDPIVAEVRKIRNEISTQCGNNYENLKNIIRESKLKITSIKNKMKEEEEIQFTNKK